MDEYRKYSEDRNNTEEVESIEYPALPKEPARLTTGVVNIVIRLPYGDRIQRKFLARPLSGLFFICCFPWVDVFVIMYYFVI